MILNSFGLIFLSGFTTSAISAITGLGGGALLLGILLSVFDPLYALFLHGVFQLFSNFSRVIVFWKYIKISFVSKFLILLIPGSLIGVMALEYINSLGLQFILGTALILSAFFTNTFKQLKISSTSFLHLGFFTGFLSMLVGATGPFLAPFFLASNLEKEEFVATKSACQMLNQLAKVMLFLVFFPESILRDDQISSAETTGMLIPLGFVGILGGTVLGKKVLSKIPKEIARILVRSLVLILGIKIIYSSLP